MGHGTDWKEQRRAMRSGSSVKSDVWNGWNIWLRSFIKKLPSMKHGRTVCTHTNDHFFPHIPTLTLFTQNVHTFNTLHLCNTFVVFRLNYSETAIINLLNVYTV